MYASHGMNNIHRKGGGGGGGGGGGAIAPPSPPLDPLLRLAHLPVKLEVGNNLTPDHDHSRPADVLVHNWSLGKPAAFDFCVTSPLNSLILSEAGVSSCRSGGSGLRDKKTQQ